MFVQNSKRVLFDYIWGTIKGAFITTAIILTIRLITLAWGAEPIIEAIKNIKDFVTSVWNVIGVYDTIVLIFSGIALMIRRLFNPFYKSKDDGYR